MNKDEMRAFEKLVDIADELKTQVVALTARVGALEDEFAERDKAAAKARRDQPRSKRG